MSRNSFVSGTFKLKHPEVHSLADVGYIFGGKLGRELLGGAFFLYMIMNSGSGMLGVSPLRHCLVDGTGCLVIRTGSLVFRTGRLGFRIGPNAHHVSYRSPSRSTHSPSTARSCPFLLHSASPCASLSSTSLLWASSGGASEVRRSFRTP
ncbi:hypothetical protein BCR35DRAFT_218505 [Leucosporidium creatinivorum]|uniref:Uncharacterized protein n=1 Tax=Leucosporidium creatinivorum TaxID=106004 RepID=A0A1Y2FX32_9BASI|nr:hypothetical protein BCR35DRAFT_218505 [Leucosporidium creatinivorum]